MDQDVRLLITMRMGQDVRLPVLPDPRAYRHFCACPPVTLPLTLFLEVTLSLIFGPF